MTQPITPYRLENKNHYKASLTLTATLTTNETIWLGLKIDEKTRLIIDARWASPQPCSAFADTLSTICISTIGTPYAPESLKALITTKEIQWDNYDQALVADPT